MRKTTTANGLRGSKWIAINTTKNTGEVIQMFEMLKLKQKGLSNFWDAFHQVRDYIN